jgi:hypothetical protein
MTIMYEPDLGQVPYANKERGDGGEGGEVDISLNYEMPAEVGQTDATNKKKPVIDMGGNLQGDGEKGISDGLRRSRRARKLPARYRD